MFTSRNWNSNYSKSFKASDKVRMRRIGFIVGCFGVILLGVVGYLGLFEEPQPAEDDVIQIIADKHDVSTGSVKILALESARDTSAVLYRLKSLTLSASPLGPVQMRFLVHQALHFEPWYLAGGSTADEPSSPSSISIHVLSSSGDTGHDINSEIYGVASPEAAVVEITVKGETYQRDVQRSGYIILLEEQGISLYDIESIRVWTADGEILPSPQLPSS